MLLSIIPLKGKPTHPSHIMDRPQSKQVLLIADANPENINILKTMPTADKYDVCRRLKADKTTKDTQDIPIILLSEPTAEDTEAKGFELGAADYITKPFKRSVIRARIRTH